MFFYISPLTRAEKLMNSILKNAMIDKRLKAGIDFQLIYSEGTLHDEVNFEVEKLKFSK